MKNLTVTSISVSGCRWILNGLKEMISLARISFKPSKLRSLKKGKVTGKFCFSLGTTKIPSLTKAPVKSLGKVFNCSLRYVASTQANNQDLVTWLAVADKSGLSGEFNAWIYQHGILPWILPISSLSEEFMVTRQSDGANVAAGGLVTMGASC